jgi:hypothetical protein
MNTAEVIWGPNKRTARVSGLLYLTVVVAGFFSLIYVPSQLIVPGDIAATVGNISASRTLFRFGIVSGFVCYLAFVLLPLMLYKLLSSTNRNAAVLMVVFALTSVPISLCNLSDRLDTLALLNGATYLDALPTAQLHALVQLTLDSYTNGVRVAELFWGLWLLPLGYLVFKSGRLPKVLGILLMLGSFGYLIHCVASVMDEQFTESTVAGLVTLPAGLGEIGTCLWLLIFGIRDQER